MSSKRPRTIVNNNTNKKNTALGVLGNSALQRLVAAGLFPDQVKALRLVCRALRYVLAAWTDVNTGVTDALEYAHRPSIKLLTVMEDWNEVRIDVTETCRNIQVLAVYPTQIAPNCCSLPEFLPFAGLKTLELVVFVTKEQQRLAPVSVDWELETLCLTLAGDYDDDRDADAREPRVMNKARVLKDEFNAFAVSLISARSSFNSLRNISIREEELGVEYSAAESDQAVLEAIALVSRTRQLDRVDLPLRLCEFPRIWTRQLILESEELSWDDDVLPPADAWLSGVKADSVIFLGCPFYQGRNVCPGVMFPNVAKLTLWPWKRGPTQESVTEGQSIQRDDGFPDDWHRLSPSVLRPLPRASARHLEAPLKLEHCGLVLGPDLISLDMTRMELTVAAAELVVRSCPSLHHLAIGVYCQRRQHDPSAEVSRAFIELVGSLPRLSSLKITNRVSRTKARVCRGGGCNFLARLFETCLCGTRVWSVALSLTVVGFCSRVDEARSSVPSYVKFNIERDEEASLENETIRQFLHRIRAQWSGV